jgi:hypothetical protein
MTLSNTAGIDWRADIAMVYRNIRATIVAAMCATRRELFRGATDVR